MKNNKKFGRIALVVALLVVVCVASIAGTIAYLKDSTTTVTNTFTSSNIGITISEAGAEENPTTKVLEQSFKMVPGSTIQKNPEVTIAANSEASHVFMQIIKENDFDNYMGITVDTDWTPYSADGFTGIYYLEQIATGNTAAVHDILLGDEVTVKTDVTKDMMDKLDNDTKEKPKLSFKAAAVQKANLTQAQAWDEVKGFFKADSTNPNP